MRERVLTFWSFPIWIFKVEQVKKGGHKSRLFLVYQYTQWNTVAPFHLKRAIYFKFVANL